MLHAICDLPTIKKSILVYTVKLFYRCTRDQETTLTFCSNSSWKCTAVGDYPKDASASKVSRTELAPFSLQNYLATAIRIDAQGEDSFTQDVRNLPEKCRADPDSFDKTYRSRHIPTSVQIYLNGLVFSCWRKHALLGMQPPAKFYQ